MSKITLTDLSSIQNDNTAVSKINTNNSALETALDNTLSRDGTSPNQMLSELDMNSNRIINLPKPFNDYEPIRLADFTFTDATLRDLESEIEGIKSLVNSSGPFEVPDYSSKSAVEAANIDSARLHVRTAGYYLAGDGGGALYKRVATEPTHEGKIQSLDGAWWEIAEPVISLKMLGAIGDGDLANSEADSVAITNAIGVIAARGAGVIYAPKGNYRIGNDAGSAVGTCIIPCSNLTFFGDGIGKTLFTQIPNSSRHLISISGLVNIIIRDMEFDGDVDNQTISGHSGIRIGDFGVDGFWLHNVKVRRVETYGVTVSGDTVESSGKHVWYNQVWVEDTGSDCFDLHNRGSEGDNGNAIIFISNCYARNPGMNTISQHDLTCFDFRGIILAQNLHCELGDPPDLPTNSTKRGIRFRQDSPSGQIGGAKSSLTNFTVLGSSAGTVNTYGVEIPADDVTVSNGYIQGVQQGLAVLGKRVSVNNVNIQEVYLRGVANGASGPLVGDDFKLNNCTVYNPTLTAGTVGINIGTCSNAQINNNRIINFPTGISANTGSHNTDLALNMFEGCTVNVDDQNSEVRGIYLRDYGYSYKTTIPVAATLDLDAQSADFQTVDGVGNISAVTLSRGRRVTVLFQDGSVINVGPSLVRNKQGTNYTASQGALVQFFGAGSGKVYFAPYGD